MAHDHTTPSQRIWTPTLDQYKNALHETINDHAERLDNLIQKQAQMEKIIQRHEKNEKMILCRLGLFESDVKEDDKTKDYPVFPEEVKDWGKR